MLGLVNYPEIPIGTAPANERDCPPQLIVLFGGMADSINGNVGRDLIPMVKTDYPKAQIAYYYWRFLRSSSAEISNVISKFSRKCLCTQVILIGHSFGGSTAAEVVAQLGNDLCKKPILVTLDAVGTMAYPPAKDQMSYWYNVYVPKGPADVTSGIPGVTSVVGLTVGWMNFNLPDWVASMGGKWGAEDGAANISLDKISDTRNHAYANKMYDLINEALKNHGAEENY